jgi:cytochrome c553
MKVFLRVMAVLLLAAAATAQAAGDAAAGEQKAAVCAACHGVDGNSTVAMWPKLAGQHEAYLARQITLIRDGARNVPEMTGIVAGLSEADINDLAAYYAGQVNKPAAADPALADAGLRLYRAGNAKTGIAACMGCHGPAGEGNALAGYPALAGQHATYVENALKRFQDGQTWGADDAPSQVMAGVAHQLTDAEIKAVASAIQGLHEAQ